MSRSMLQGGKHEFTSKCKCERGNVCLVVERGAQSVEVCNFYLFFNENRRRATDCLFDDHQDLLARIGNRFR